MDLQQYQNLVSEKSENLYYFLQAVPDRIWESLPKVKTKVFVKSGLGARLGSLFAPMHTIQVKISYQQLQPYLPVQIKRYAQNLRRHEMKSDQYVAENSNWITWDGRFDGGRLTAEPKMVELMMRNPRQKYQCRMELIAVGKNPPSLAFLPNWKIPKETQVPEFPLQDVKQVSAVYPKQRFKIQWCRGVFGSAPLSYICRHGIRQNFVYDEDEGQFKTPLLDQSQFAGLCQDVLQNGLSVPLPVGIAETGQVCCVRRYSQLLVLAEALELFEVPVFGYIELRDEFLRNAPAAVKQDLADMTALYT